jgi:hypothetical protein
MDSGMEHIFGMQRAKDAGMQGNAFMEGGVGKHGAKDTFYKH